MDEAKYQELLQAIRDSKKDVQQEIADLKKDVTAAQEKSSQELASKISKSTYQFRRKGNEIQFTFNATVADSISSAKKELERFKPTEKEAQETLKKAQQSLDEGMEAIEKRQKHIRVADSSDYGWSTVQLYDAHPLAADSEDEKRLEKAEREAERLANKRRKGGNFAARKRRNWGDGPSSRKEPQGTNTSGGSTQVHQTQPRPRVVGPCYRCAAWGHLAANCTAKEKVYPFCQPAVSKAEAADKANFNVGVNDVCNDQSVNNPLVSNGAICTEAGTSCVKTLSEICAAVLKKVATGKECPQCVIYDPEPMEASLDNGWEQVDSEASQFWELEALEFGTQLTDVQGRIKKNISFWRDVLHAPQMILDCIASGYCLPLKFLPPPYSQNNNISTLRHQHFVDEALTNLLKNRCIVQVKEKPSPLSVVSNSTGKLRLVLNLRYLNQFLQVVSFKYEDLRIAALMFEKDEYLFKFDLKSGYHHIDIHPEHHKYLGFRWDGNDKTNYYVFTVLPFGLSSACYLFTKLMRPLVRHWRGRGLKAIVYLDDGIVAIKGEKRACEESRLVKYELESAGFVLNQEKSLWIPSKSVEWLGFNIDLAIGEFSVPPSKLEVLKSQLHAVVEAPRVPARQLASVIGKIMSMSLALGPVTRLMTRSLYFVLNQRTAWCQSLVITPEASQELTFWLREIAKFNGRYTVQLDLNLSKNRVWCCTHTQYVQFQSRLALRVHAKLLTRILLAGTSRVSTRVPDVSSSACIIEYLERMQHESTCARELSL